MAILTLTKVKTYKNEQNKTKKGEHANASSSASLTFTFQPVLHCWADFQEQEYEYHEERLLSH